MKRFALAIVSVLIVSGLSWAAGDLLRTPGNFINQTAIQQCAPTAGLNRKAISTQKGYVNYSTTSTSCLDVDAYTGTVNPTAVAVKYRIGGFATGTETDTGIVPSTGKVIWPGLGVTKVGFQIYSGATVTTTYIGGAKGN